MKRYIKSYLAFTPFIYRIVMFIIVPIVIVGIGFYLGNVFIGNSATAISAISLTPLWASSFAVLFIVPIEIIADNWSFGGIQSKRVVDAAYLNTSYKGMEILRRAVCIDLIRKLIYEICIAVITYLLLLPICIRHGASLSIGADIGADIFALIIVVLTAHLFSVLGVLITRYGDMLWLNMVMAYIIQILMMLSIYLVDKIYDEGLMLFDIACGLLLAILDVAACMLSVKAAVRGYKRNYYDA